MTKTCRAMMHLKDAGVIFGWAHFSAMLHAGMAIRQGCSTSIEATMLPAMSAEHISLLVQT